MARDPYKYFRVEARELVEQLGKGLLDLERDGGGDMVAQLLRLAHTLKGAARVVKQPGIADHAHAIEGLLQPFRDGGAVDGDTIEGVLSRVDEIASGIKVLSQPEPTDAPADSKESQAAVKRQQEADDSYRTLVTEVEEIDALLEGVSESFAQLNMLRTTVASVERARHVAELLAGPIAAPGDSGSRAAVRSDRAASLAEELRNTIGGLERNLGSACDRVGRELQQVREIAEQLRLAPVGMLFNTLERAARDSAQVLGKSVRFVGKGGDVRLDGHVLRTLQGALVQIVRNAVAHGIESPTERASAGKPAEGTVSIGVERRGSRVVFRCMDDGNGVDLEAVRRTALQRGVAAVEIERMDAGGLVNLLLGGGLSTSANVNEVAGRGIGMDIVRESVARLGGEVLLETNPGHGTVLELVVPVSLAAIDALVVESGGSVVTIPLDAVRHTLRIAPEDISCSANGESIVIDDKAVPFVPLSRMLRHTANGKARHDVSAVIIGGAGGFAAIGVERLLGTANIVLRPLPELTPRDAVVAGASFDAEGNPQLVLDPDGLIGEANGTAAQADGDGAKALPVLVIDDSLTTRMLEQSILESAGYEVDVASSAEEGLECARRRTYALILVDVEMPGMDGFTFIERIRAEPALAGIPAILVTSLSSPESIKRGEAVGAQGYMIKSEFDQTRLLAQIRQLTVPA